LLAEEYADTPSQAADKERGRMDYHSTAKGDRVQPSEQFFYIRIATLSLPTRKTMWRRLVDNRHTTPEDFRVKYLLREYATAPMGTDSTERGALEETDPGGGQARETEMAEEEEIGEEIQNEEELEGLTSGSEGSSATEEEEMELAADTGDDHPHLQGTVGDRRRRPQNALRNRRLKRIYKDPFCANPDCKEDGILEDHAHILNECRVYSGIRRTLRDQLKQQSRDLRRYGGGEPGGERRTEVQPSGEVPRDRHQQQTEERGVEEAIDEWPMINYAAGILPPELCEYLPHRGQRIAAHKLAVQAGLEIWRCRCSLHFPRPPRSDSRPPTNSDQHT